MCARTAEEAVSEVLDPLQRVVSCVSRAVLVRGSTPPGRPRFVSLGENPTRVHGSYHLGLRIFQWYEVLQTDAGRSPEWHARTTSYAYVVQRAEGQMILAYHWHPSGQSWATFSHLHIAGPISSIDVNKAHLPTVLVTPQEFLAFIIRDLGVRPLRPDWRDVLALDVDDLVSNTC